MSLRRSTGKEKPDDHSKQDAPLAQLAEQLTLNQWVPGSSPGGCTTGKTASGSRQREPGAVLLCATIRPPCPLASGNSLPVEPSRLALPYCSHFCSGHRAPAAADVAATKKRGPSCEAVATPGRQDRRFSVLTANSPPMPRRRENWQTGWRVPAPLPGAPAAAGPDRSKLRPARTAPFPPQP